MSYSYAFYAICLIVISISIHLLPPFVSICQFYLLLFLGSICLSLFVRLMAYFSCLISKTNRIHFIEIIDEWWCPPIFHEFLTRMLYEFVWKKMFGTKVAFEIEKIVKNNKCEIILDLCSGCGGPSEIINTMINSKRDKKNKILTILTDLYPEYDSWSQICDNNTNITYNKESINAANMNVNQLTLYKNNSIIKNKTIIRTLCGSFHHFKPDLCTEIFYDGFINDNIVIICDPWSNKSFSSFLRKFIIINVMSHIGLFLVIKFWLFRSKLNINKRIIKCILLITLWPIFVFGTNHDQSITEARLYSDYQIQNMAQKAAKQANKKYLLQNIPIFIFEGQRAMTLFVCIPQKNNT
eukprot:233519_1